MTASLFPYLLSVHGTTGCLFVYFQIQSNDFALIFSYSLFIYNTIINRHLSSLSNVSIILDQLYPLTGCGVLFSYYCIYCMVVSYNHTFLGQKNSSGEVFSLLSYRVSSVTFTTPTAYAPIITCPCVCTKVTFSCPYVY